MWLLNDCTWGKADHIFATLLIIQHCSHSACVFACVRVCVTNCRYTINVYTFKCAHVSLLGSSIRHAGKHSVRLSHLNVSTVWRWMGEKTGGNIFSFVWKRAKEETQARKMIFNGTFIGASIIIHKKKVNLGDLPSDVSVSMGSYKLLALHIHNLHITNVPFCYKSRHKTSCNNLKCIYLMLEWGMLVWG